MVRRLFQAATVLALMMAAVSSAIPAGASSHTQLLTGNVKEPHGVKVISGLAVDPDVSCTWTSGVGPPYTGSSYSQSGEPTDEVLGSPYCFHYSSDDDQQCEFYTEWGVFDGVPFASLELVSGTDCATNELASADSEQAWNSNSGTDGPHGGPYAFNTWSQAYAPAGSIQEARFIVCMFQTPGNPNSNEQCLQLTYT
jgi:hypothetical protein